MDVYVNTVVEAIVDEIPTNVKEGSIYIINNELAQYVGGGWVYYPALEYMEVWLRDKQTKMVFNGKKWLDIITLLGLTKQEEQNNGK